jgi:hypothetical protein
LIRGSGFPDPNPGKPGRIGTVCKDFPSRTDGSEERLMAVKLRGRNRKDEGGSMKDESAKSLLSQLLSFILPTLFFILSETGVRAFWEKR